MIDEDFNFSFDEDSLYDIVKHSDQYRWKPSFHFYGSRSKEQANGYGSSIPTQELYELLDDPFIERYFDTVYPYLDIKKQGDDLIYEMSKELFPYVENIGFSEKEAEEIKRRLKTNETRLENAEEILEENNFLVKITDIIGVEMTDTPGGLTSVLKVIRENDVDLEYLYADAVYTKSGNLDKRYKVTRNIYAVSEDINGLEKELNRLESNVNRERSRYMNSQEKYTKSVDNARKMLENTENMFSTSVKQAGKDFAKAVRQDIIIRAESGSLPLQNSYLQPRTVQLRQEAGLPDSPKFYASGQLMNSIVVDFVLERR